MLALLTAAILSQAEGIKWLARHQDEDGSWGRRVATCTCPHDDFRGLPPVPRDERVGKRAVALIEKLHADDADVRQNASLELEGLGIPAAPYLDDVREAKDADLRAHVDELLRKIASKRCPGDVASTAFALLALFGAGYSHLSRDECEAGTLGKVVKRGLQWLIARQNVEGGVGTLPDDGVTVANVLAALAFSESYGMTRSNGLKQPAQQAVDYILLKQRASGAWGAGADDVMTTLWAVQLVKSAELGELRTSAAAMRRAIDWLGVTAEKGVTVEMAAYVAAANLGKRGGEAEPVARRLSCVKPCEMPAVTRLVASLALFQQDGPNGALWKGWNEKLKDGLVLSQKTARHGCERGSWTPGAEDRTRTSHTAVQMLTLEVYYRYANVLGVQK